MMTIGRWRLDGKILLACLALVGFILAVNMIGRASLDADKGKLEANRIMSPWDRSAAPPVMGPSEVIVKPLPTMAPVPEPDSRHNVSTARHHHRWHRTQRQTASTDR